MRLRIHTNSSAVGCLRRERPPGMLPGTVYTPVTGHTPGIKKIAEAPKFGSAASYYFRLFKEYWWYYNTQEESEQH